MTAVTSAIAAMVSSERSLGWLVAKRIRAMPVSRDGPEHLGEARLSVQVAPVGVHVLAQQRDLEHALSNQASTSATMSSSARLRSRPRTYGTMQ